MNRWKVLLLFVIFLGCGGRGVSVYAAGEYDWILLPGETLYLPEKGEVLEYDEDFLRQEEDGSFSLAGEGEGEIIVRYRIRGEGTKEAAVPPEGAQEEKTADLETAMEETFFNEAEEETADAGDVESTEKAEGEEEFLPEPETGKADPVSPENEMGQEETAAVPPPQIQEAETAVTITYDRRYAYRSVPKNFTPEVLLPEAPGIQVISCSVNGVEERYEVQDNHLIIGREALRPGKNRIIITVRDKAGQLLVMEPWEFEMEEEAPVCVPQKEETQTQDQREQKLSLGLILLLLGSTLVYYEKQKFLAGK